MWVASKSWIKCANELSGVTSRISVLSFLEEAVARPGLEAFLERGSLSGAVAPRLGSQVRAHLWKQ